MPQSGAKERPTMENSDVLNRNFDLSVVDHTARAVATVVVVHLCSFCGSSYVTTRSTRKEPTIFTRSTSKDPTVLGQGIHTFSKQSVFLTTTD